MADKKKKLSDREIVSVLDQHLARADGRGATTRSQEREEVLKYYNGELPLPVGKRSKFNSNDIYDNVESTKAVILNAIHQGLSNICFTPEDDKDEVEARVATAYTDHVLNKLNPGSRILHDAMHDALLARNAVVKVWWEKITETEEFEINGTQDAVMLMMQEMQNGVSEQDKFKQRDDEPLEIDPETGQMSGKLYKDIDRSQVRIANIPAEEFIINPGAKCIQEATFIAHRSRRRISELVAQGYDEDKLEQARSASDDLSFNSERIARADAAGEDGTEENQDDQLVQVEECYVYLNVDGKSEKRWQVTKVGDYILEKQVADTVRFVSYCALPVSHTFWGNNYAARLIPTQNVNSTIMRSLVDQTVFSSIPRYMVAKGGLKNPAELTDLRFGGMVNVDNLNAVGLLPQPTINPYVMTTLELMATKAESISGVSRTAMGINQNVVGKQNSGALLDQVTSASQQKMTLSAKWLAEFIAELKLAIYDLALRYEKKEVIVEVAGSYVPVSPEKWRERRQVTAELHLSPEHRQAEAQRLVATFTMFSQDPALASMFGAEQKRLLAAKYLSLTGLPNVDKVLLPVEQAAKPGPDPNLQLQMKLIEAQQQANMAQVQIGQMKAQATLRQAQLTAEVKALKGEQDFALRKAEIELKAMTEERKSAELDHSMQMEEANLELARDAQDVNAIIKLTSGS
jgi:hypothetical protein